MSKYFVTIHPKNPKIHQPTVISNVTRVNGEGMQYLVVDTKDSQYFFRHSEILGYVVSIEKGTVE